MHAQGGLKKKGWVSCFVPFFILFTNTLSMNLEAQSQTGSQQASMALQARIGSFLEGQQGFQLLPQCFHSKYSNPLSHLCGPHFEAGSLAGLELIKQGRLVGQQAPRICLYPSFSQHGLRLQALAAKSSLGFGGLNLGPHTRTARTTPTKLSPQSLLNILKIKVQLTKLQNKMIL